MFSVKTLSTIPKSLGFSGGINTGKTLPFLIVLVTILAFSITSCEIKIGGKGKKDKEQDAAAPVIVKPVESGDISSFLRINSVVEPKREILIFPKTIGTISEINVEEGDRVNTGQILAKLDQDEQLLALRSAEAAFTRQKLVLEKSQELFDRQMLADDDFENVKLALKDAEIALEQAKLALDYTEIRSPFSGVIAERSVEVGDRVSSARSLFRIVDNSILLVNSWITETDLRFLKTGMNGIVTASSDPDIEFNAHLIRISPVVDPAYGKIKVTFEVDGKRLLKPGQFVEIALILDTHKDVRLTPKKSVVYEAGEAVLFVLQDTLALRRPIKTGLETGDLVELLSGVDIGDSVIIEGQSTLRDSSIVKLINLSSR